MVLVIGAGLAGTEAAWQIAQAGLPVRLVEMRPVRRSPAHHSAEFAELVCSNSFGALSSDRAAGLLQEELRQLGSLVISTADGHSVPAGGALAVDRGRFSADLTRILETHPLIQVERVEQLRLPEPEEITVLATGPLTSDSLAEDLRRFTGRDDCHFFDAASPIVAGDGSSAAMRLRMSRRRSARYCSARECKEVLVFMMRSPARARPLRRACGCRAWRRSAWYSALDAGARRPPP